MMTGPKNPFVQIFKPSRLQNLKMLVLGLTLLPIRLLIALICLTLATLLAFVGLRGLDNKQLESRPFTGWRLGIRYALCYILRFMFGCCGFFPRVKGKQALPSEAPILVVAPHSTFFDSLAVVMMGAPAVVAKAETSSLPFWGSLIKYTQPVLVHRNDQNSRQNTINQISERTEAGSGWQQVFIFPEGTCTNRSSLITFRLGSFYPGVAVQPVVIRYENELDTVTWTWEGRPAWWVIFHSLSQFYIKISLEFLPIYHPSQQEKEDPKLFSANVRAVMAESLGVPTTDSNYFDYLRMEKASNLLKSVQKLQKKMEIGLVEATANMLPELDAVPTDTLAEKLGVPKDSDELNTVLTELCGQKDEKVVDLRNLRVAAMISSEEDSFGSFVRHTFSLFDPNLGDYSLSATSLGKVCESFLFLTPKEVAVVIDDLAADGTVTKEALAQFLNDKKPNYAKVIRRWEGGLVGGMGDLLAMSASLTKDLNKTMEKVALSGSNLISAGKEVVSDVSATVAASRDLMSDAISSAVISLHKRTGSRTEAEVSSDKKSD